jgi:hypothetical protein
MNTSEKFEPSFSQYFLVKTDGVNVPISFKVPSFNDLEKKIEELNKMATCLSKDKITGIERILFNEHFKINIETEIIEIQSLLDFTIDGICGMEENRDKGLYPLLYNLTEVRSKLESIIDRVEKQAVFYDEDYEGGGI